MNKKKLLSIFLMIATTNQANASCDFSKDIKENLDGTFTYSKDCNVEVGKRIKELDIRRQQIEDFNKAITLKDLAISKADERAKAIQDSTDAA